LGLDTSILVKQLDNDLVPIVSPLSADDQGTVLNINADTVAAMIACELKAEKFVMATSAPGILESLEDPRSLISYIDRAGLRRLREEGKISGGMLPKVAAIERALSGGVPRVHVISYAQADSLLLEVFTNEGTGTLVVNDTKALWPEEQAS
jgi:acetylglutamate kinase